MSKKTTLFKVPIKYRERKQICEFPSLDYETLDLHIELLCTSRELGLCVSGSYQLYCLYLAGGVMKPEDFRREDRLQLMLTQGMELSLKPTCTSQQKLEVEVMSFISDMKDSKDDNTIKAACWKLITKLQEDNFAKIFREKNGHSALVDVIKDSKGGCLSYALRALDAYMGHYSFSGGQQFNEKIFASLTDINMNVVISALHTLNICIDPKSNNKGASIYWNNHRKTIPIQKLAKDFSPDSEANLRMEVLTLFNNIMSLSPEEDRRSNISLLHELADAGVAKALMEPRPAALKAGAEWNYQVWRYQNHLLDASTIEKTVNFDDKNVEHINMLKSFWSVVKPGTPFPGLISDQWKTVGFQGKNPTTDFRGAGMLGLKHLLYFAKHKPERIKSMVDVQNSRDMPHQYPLGATGMNITAKLAEIFKIGKEVPPDTEPPFFPILFSAPEVYEQIYIIAYERFDRKWQNMNALYMQFSQVIHILVQSMEEVIAKKPKSIKELERLLDNSSMLNSQTNIPLAEMISPGSPTSPRTNSGTLIRSPSDLRNPAEYVNVASPGTTGSVSPSVSPTPESSNPVSPPPTLVRSPSHEKTSAPPDKAPPPVPAGPKPTRPPPRPPRTDLQASPSAPASPHTFTPASPQEESSEAVEPKIGFRPARRTGSGFTSALNLALSNGPKEDVPSRSHTLSNSQSTPDLRTSDLHKSRTLPTNATLSPPADVTSPLSRKNTPNIGGNSSSKYLIPVPAASPNETEEEKNQRMRSTVIYEIMSTEIDYVNDLNILKNVFKLPLEIQVCKVGGLRTEEINVLFSNAETLLKCNEQLVADWQEAVEAGERDIDIIVDIFEKMSQFFKMYTFYCANQPQSIAKFEELKKNPTFISTLKRCESDTQCRNLSLKDFLIKPVQRICKYPLFFTQMIRYTSESEPAFKRLRDCQKKIEETAAYINDFRVKDEKIQRVVEIQDNFDPPLTFELVTNNRRFIKEATIRGKVYNQETTELNLFIFNDLLLITRKKAKGAYQFKLKIALESLRYVELADTENSKNAFTLEHSEVKSDSITIFAENNAEKSEWRKDIKSMVNDYNKKKINEMAKAKSKNLNSP